MTETTARASRPTKALILMSDTGGGHRASAEALKSAIFEQHGAECEVTIVDFWVDLAGFPFHRFPEQYAFLARHPMLWKASYVATKFGVVRALMDFIIDLLAHDRIREAILELEPDIIVSVHPLVQQLTVTVLDALEEVSLLPRVPFITVVTDFGDAHPTWFHRDADLCYVPSEPVKAVAESEGITEDKLRLFGLPVRSSFWNDTRSQQQVRESLGLDVSKSTVLVVGGGDGVGGLEAVVRTIAVKLSEVKLGSTSQIVVVCGRNRTLAASMRSWQLGVSLIVLEFVSNMHEWMIASNMIVTKAGPGTIAESMICGLPIILSSFLPGQEEGNMRFVVDQDIGFYSDKPEEIAETVVEWLGDPEQLAVRRSRALEYGRPHATLEIVSDIWKQSEERWREIEEKRSEIVELRRTRMMEAEELEGRVIERSGRWSMEMLGCSPDQPFETDGRKCLLVPRLAVLLRATMQSLRETEDSWRERAMRVRSE
eukprot:CAMPEP_0185851224 /NCGR_PEP_ID=MMETSP1354-20130828/7877_1 /TAXON_ID=708628 /ORGANISM="Erythrolobus madagascarensis, Strain CCMP3276" /LENGTH=484 /DNA_ID=CAMNT_0028552163 /DNA_START=86 /DNA_END=1540 /DNA_ORIENTATION=-